MAIKPVPGDLCYGLQPSPQDDSEPPCDLLAESAGGAEDVQDDPASDNRRFTRTSVVHAFMAGLQQGKGTQLSQDENVSRAAAQAGFQVLHSFTILDDSFTVATSTLPGLSLAVIGVHAGSVMACPL
jgi:hypothetical protein